MQLFVEIIEMDDEDIKELLGRKIIRGKVFQEGVTNIIRFLNYLF